MRGCVNSSGINRIFILGAGFSAPAGFPLTSELLRHVHVAASRNAYNNGQSRFGQAETLLERLRFYYPLASFSHEMILRGDVPSEFDLEKFLTYVNVESACQWNTGERFDEHGNEVVSKLKRWIAQAIFQHQEIALTNIPDFYHKFVSLVGNAIVFTFNWDTFLESLFEINEITYELDSRSNLDPTKVSLFKLHGSIDWFSYPPDYLRRDWMEFKKLGESFERFYRAKTNDASLADYYRAHLTPWIIVPAYDKISQIREYGDLWTALYMFFQNELEVVIIGFSMREDDYHTRAIIYPQLVQGSQQGNLRVKVVNLARSSDEKEAIKSKFSGVKNCSFFFEGFSDKAIEFIGN